MEVFSLVVQGSAFGPLDQVLIFFSVFSFWGGWRFSLDLFRVHPLSPTYGPGPQVGTRHISVSVFGGGGGVGRIDCRHTNKLKLLHNVVGPYVGSCFLFPQFCPRTLVPLPLGTYIQTGFHRANSLLGPTFQQTSDSRHPQEQKTKKKTLLTPYINENFNWGFVQIFGDRQRI